MNNRILWKLKVEFKFERYYISEVVSDGTLYTLFTQYALWTTKAERFMCKSQMNAAVEIRIQKLKIRRVQYNPD